MRKSIFFDTETTGVNPQKDLIIEIAAYDPEGNREFVSFVNPGCPIPPDATAIHKITDEMVQDAPSFAEVGEQFREFCGQHAVLIAHNNDRFDKLFLHEEANRHRLEWPKSWLYFDTLNWARRYRPDLPRHSLQFLRDLYGIPANNAHRALDDVLVLHKVFSLMTDDLTTEQLVDLLLNPRKTSHMPFGKYRGKPLEQVPQDYFKWLMGSGALDKPENEELKLVLVEKGLL